MTLFEMNLHEAQNQMLFKGSATLEREDLETLLNSTTETTELCDTVTSECGDISILCTRIAKNRSKIDENLTSLLSFAQEKELPKEIIGFIEESLKLSNIIDDAVDDIRTSTGTLSDKAYDVGFSG